MAGWEDFIGPALQVGGGLASEALTAEDRAALQRRIQSALAEHNGLSVPDLPSVNAEQLGPSAYEGISLDPRLRDAQQRSLDSFGEMERMGGLTLEDRAALNQQLGRASRQEQAQRQSLARDFSNRGQLGSGAQLAMSMQGQQQSAQMGNNAALDTAANAQRRYFDAIRARGQQAGQMENADYGRQSDAARARDVIAQHNAASRQQANLYNAGLPAQRFGMQHQLANSRSNAQLGAASQQREDINSRAGMIAGVGDAAGKGYTAYRDGQRKDEELELLRKRTQGGGY